MKQNKDQENTPIKSTNKHTCHEDPPAEINLVSSTVTENFFTILQRQATNTLARISTDNAQVDLNGTGLIIDKDFKLYISNYNELKHGIRQTAKLLLDAFIIKVTESGQKETLVKLS